MAQEDNSLGGSFSGGGRGGGGGGGGGGSGAVTCSRSKKIKQKKVPQRGLGVAQLEKIRLEEQQRRESLQAANILAKNAVGSSNDSNSFLGVQKFRPSFSPFHNSVPLPLPPPSSDLPPPFRHIQSVPNIEVMQENPVQASKQSDGGGGGGGGGEIDSRAISSPRMWGGGYNLVREKVRLDHHGFTFDPQVTVSYEDTPVLPLPFVSQRSHHFHQPTPSSSSSSMVNPSSGISPSSAVSSQMEPPSNQSFRGNNYAPLWTEEDKMVGMKRSYPFSLESPPFHRMYAASSSKSDDLALCSNGYTDRTDQRNRSIRGGPSSSSPLPERKQIEATMDDGRLNGDFLTLAPPSSATPPSNVKHKVPLSYSGYQGHDYECRPSQEHVKSQIHRPGSSGSVEQPFSFFPMKLQHNQTTNDVSNGNGENGDTIDLNLKL